MAGLTEIVEETLKKVSNKICDEYCKYPEKYTVEEWNKIVCSDESPCNSCPLEELM